jgi:arginyl-tRNA synthetase
MTANLFARYESLLRTECTRLIEEGRLPAGLDLDRVTVEEPRDPAHGDLATNAAMVLARPARLTPRAIAEMLVAGLGDADGIDSLEIAGPGFINIRLRIAAWHETLIEALRLGPDFATVSLGAGEPVNIEYVSANPTGPLHVGHCRGAVVGDALANLLARAGFVVTREYYINDAGAQIDTLARSAYLRYREALGEEIGDIPSGLYPGDYLKPVGAAIAAQHGRALLQKDEADWLAIVADAAVAAMMDQIRDDLAALAIRHDVFFSERSLTAGTRDLAHVAIDILRARGLIYEGRLPPPKGQTPDDWEDREQTLFRSTAFGDDVDRPLMKSDGSYTYFASDIAYHYDKFARGFSSMIDVWGADHGGYVKRMKAAVEATTEGQGRLDVRLCQMVRLFRGGDPVTMSKRAGEFVTLRALVDEVGADAVRFMMLMRRSDAPLDFDFVKVAEQSRDNPVFYVQYAHARISSVFRNAAELVPDFDPGEIDAAATPVALLSDEFEIQLIRRLAHFPRTLEAAAVAHEPHRIAFYLYDLASDFHALWNRGKELPHLRFIDAGRLDYTHARLAMLAAVAYVLREGLALLGVSAPEEMA